MRDLVLKMSLSLDGFVAAPDGDIAWMFGPDPEAKAWSVRAVSDAGLHAMGSRTFQAMAAHWPTATDAFAPAMNSIPKVVFSSQGPAILATARTPDAGGWAHARIAGGDLADEIAALKAGDGGPIVAHGGAAFARSLVALGLVDEYRLLVHPTALGAGLPIFSGLAAPRRLALVASTAFPGGTVAQVYRPA